MFSNFRDQLIYCGLMDDVVDRYPWPNPVDLPALQQHLVASAIYGKTILVNDGYLTANPILVPDLMDINRSLVGALLSSGAARLFTRSPEIDLAGGLERTAQSGVKTHQSIVNDRNQWCILRATLEALQKQVGYNALVWRQDIKSGRLFHHLMERIAELGGEPRKAVIPPGLNGEFDQVFKIFAQEMSKTAFSAARTAWESACWQQIAGRTVDPVQLGTIRTLEAREAEYPGYSRVRPLMNLGNEVYHLALAILAAGPGDPKSGTGTGAARIGVSTALISVFDDLIAAEAPPAGLMDTKKAAGLRRLLIALPSSITFKPDFSFVRSFETDVAARACRDAYTEALVKFVNDKISFRDAAQTRTAYTAKLAELMAPSVKMNTTFAAASFASGHLLGQLAGLPSFLVGRLLLAFGLDKFNTRLFERLLVRQVDDALTGSYLAQTERDAEQPARQLGFYYGPLRQEGIASIQDKCRESDPIQ